MNKTEKAEGKYSSDSLDLEGLAATIMLAAEALAAAAEALVEAARAILDASCTFEASPLAEDISNIKIPVKVYEEPSSRNESEINKGLLGQVDPRVLPDRQEKLRGISTPASPVALDSLNSRREVGVVPTRSGMPRAQADQPAAPRSPQHGSKDNLPEKDTVEPQEDNKPDALPPYAFPVLSTSKSGNKISPTWPPEAIVTGNPQAPPFSNFRVAMKSHMIPPGRNYVHFGEASDALAFIAYLALQANRTVCMIPMQLMESYSKLLKSLSHANVYRTYTSEQVSRIVGSRIDFFAPTSYNIVITPSSEFIANAESFKRAAPDCIVHWGIPSDAHQYIDRVLAPLSPAVKTCMMVIRQPYFNGQAYGVRPYSNAVLNACSHVNSPLEPLRQIASSLFSASITPTLPGPQASGPHPSPLPSGPLNDPVPLASHDQNQNQNSLPPGHFYVVLDTANDIDVVPVIAYIATKHEKVICYVPSDSSLDGYHRLVASISNVNVIAPSPLVKGNQIKAMTNRLKSERSGALLRPISTGWNSYFSKSIANAVFYCGVPADLKVYLYECITKVDHSYLVLTRSQYSDIQSQLALDQRIQQHPHIRRPDSYRPTDLLYNLRQKLVPYLK